MDEKLLEATKLYIGTIIANLTETVLNDETRSMIPRDEIVGIVRGISISLRHLPPIVEALQGKTFKSIDSDIWEECVMKVFFEMVHDLPEGERKHG